MRSNLIKNKLDFIFASRYKKDGKSDDDTFLTKLGNYCFASCINMTSFYIKSTKITHMVLI